MPHPKGLQLLAVLRRGELAPKVWKNRFKYKISTGGDMENTADDIVDIL